MKLSLCYPDANHHADGPVSNLILSHLDIGIFSDPDAVVVPCVWHPGYTFNEELLSINKPIVIIEMLEFGWDYGDKENRLGYGTGQWPEHLKSAEWDKLDVWVRDHPPALTLKRELWQRDVTDKMKPIDFPSSVQLPPIQSKAEFEARPIEVFHCYGLSNPARPAFHGEIFKQAHKHGINFIDSFELDNHFEGRTWATIYTPHYNRQPMSEVMRWQHRSKVSVSLPGAGQKTFRDAEACCGAIMALQEDRLAWSYPWIDGENCIRVWKDNIFTDLLSAIDYCQLYAMYVACQTTAAKYQAPNYARDYILPTIKAAL